MDAPAPIAPTPLALPRRTHLRAAPEFQRVFTEGRRLSGSLFRLHALAAPAADAGAPPARIATLGDGARLGITVSKRVDKRAVGRNRVRRQVRESFRRNRPVLPAGDYVVLAKPEAAKADNATLRAELDALWRRAAALGTMPPAVPSDRRPPSAS